MSKNTIIRISSALWMLMAVGCVIVILTTPSSAPDWEVRAWGLGAFLSGQAGLLVQLLEPGVK